MQELSAVHLFPVCSPTLVNNRSLHEVKELAQHVILHADNGREWSRWLAASGATNIPASGGAFSVRRALGYGSGHHGNGVALGETVTIDQPLRRAADRPDRPRGSASNSFYLVCRNGAGDLSGPRVHRMAAVRNRDTRLARISRANVHD